MGDFGSVDWKLFERFLFSQGCTLKRIKGDHRIYAKEGLLRPLVVPQCSPLPIFVILNNLRVLGVEKKLFLLFLKK